MLLHQDKATAVLERLHTQEPTVADYSHKTAIIGAGFCGLGIAGAFERHGVAYDCFEADDQIGGNWYHGVYETVHIISSRKTTAFSEYPMPASYPDFPSAAQMLAYLNDYADHFNIRQHVQLSTAVDLVAPAANDKWEITLSNGEKRLYGSVVIANGHHWNCRMPNYPGKFAGQIIHSKEYKNPQILKGKRVLVIGGGNSACDVAVEAARFAESSHISMRRGYWIVPKTIMGIPVIEHARMWMPLWFQRLYLKSLLKIVVGSYEKYGLQKPDHNLYEHHPTINSELLYFIRQGLIQPHSDIARYDRHRVEFTDGSSAEFDLIVAATGYNLSLPVLAPGVVEWKNGLPQLIGLSYSTKFKNMYVFGMGQARYGAGPLISAGAESLCLLMDAQRKLKHPVGAVLQRVGGKIPTTNILGPEDAHRGSKQVKRLAPLLPLIEKLTMRDEVK